MKLEKFKIDMLLMGWKYAEPLEYYGGHIWTKNGCKILKSYLTDTIRYHSSNNNFIGRNFGSFESVLHHLILNGDDDAAEVEEYHYEGTLQLDIQSGKSRSEEHTSELQSR